MGLSLMQRSQLRKRAALEAATTAPAQTMAGATSYELQLAQLAQDRARLKQIQSQQGKVALKRQLLPAYEPYVSGVLSGGRGSQDDVLTTVMLWLIDVGNYGPALDVAEYVLEHKLVMPDRFARTTGCLIAEEIAHAALQAQKLGNPFNRAQLLRTADLTAQEDMPDEVKAKLQLAIGRAHLGLVDVDQVSLANLMLLQEARASIAQAIELHGSCGGKKDLEQVERLLKKQPLPEPVGQGAEAPAGAVQDGQPPAIELAKQAASKPDVPNSDSAADAPQEGQSSQAQDQSESAPAESSSSSGADDSADQG
ncbi:phage terminase small subunit [Pseudomonas sp. 21LCFQ010]|uniref:phage terminase small subunit n=1 Tax=Pseudomonas sp. 21LCFQ010 TaxID=2957506 RepID=UPI003454B468